MGGEDKEVSAVGDAHQGRVSLCIGIVPLVRIEDFTKVLRITKGSIRVRYYVESLVVMASVIGCFIYAVHSVAHFKETRKDS